MKYPLLFVFCFLLISCRESYRSESHEIVSVNIENVGSKKLADIISEFKLISLGQADSIRLIGEVTKIQIWENIIYIFDRQTQSIFAFDQAGKSIYKINNFGEGPGEYNLLIGFSISKTSGLLYAFDAGHQKMLVYDARSGNFLREKRTLPISCFNFEVLNDNFFVFYQGKSQGMKSDVENMFEGIATDSTFNQVIDQYFPYENGTSAGYLPFPPLLQYADGLDFLPHYEQKIYKIQPTRPPQLEYELDLGSYNLNIEPLLNNQRYTRESNWVEKPIENWIYYFGFIQSKNNALFRFDLNGKKYVVIQDKNSKFTSSFNKIEENILGFRGIPFGYWEEKDYFISYLEPGEVIESRNASDFKSHSWSKRLYKELKNLKTSDNPIIILYRY